MEFEQVPARLQTLAQRYATGQQVEAETFGELLLICQALLDRVLRLQAALKVATETEPEAPTA